MLSQYKVPAKSLSSLPFLAYQLAFLVLVAALKTITAPARGAICSTVNCTLLPHVTEAMRLLFIKGTLLLPVTLIEAFHLPLSSYLFSISQSAVVHPNQVIPKSCLTLKYVIATSLQFLNPPKDEGQDSHAGSLGRALYSCF